jgi:hypothetical protein
VLRRSGRGITTLIAAVLVFAASAAITSAAVADEPDGIGLTVTVTSTPTPISTSSPSPSSNSGSGTVVTPVGEPSPSQSPRPGEESLGGILYVSGLSFEGRQVINPAATAAQLQFTVRNVSDTVITATATFQVDNVLGLQLGEKRTVLVYRLKPDETRVVQATISDLGQWGVLHGTVVLTPPTEVEGVSLAPLTREQFFFVLPWFASIFVVLAAAVFAIIWIVRYTAIAAASRVSRSDPE